MLYTNEDICADYREWLLILPKAQEASASNPGQHYAYSLPIQSKVELNHKEPKKIYIYASLAGIYTMLTILILSNKNQTIQQHIAEMTSEKKLLHQ